MAVKAPLVWLMIFPVCVVAAQAMISVEPLIHS
jgi:hypothetical protein